MKLVDITEWCKKGPELQNYPYICDVDIDAKDYEMGTLLLVEGEYYAIGVLEHKNNIAGCRKINLDQNPEEKEYESDLVCPYCGYADRNSWELSNDEDEHICGQCSAVMSFERVVTVEYSSYPVRLPEIVAVNKEAKA